MRFRSSALALLGALAVLLAGTGAHRHADRGPALDKPCTICAIQAQSVATCPAEATACEARPQLALDVLQRAPLAHPFRIDGSAAPRGPPLTY
jgi:hypothetical protein